MSRAQELCESRGGRPGLPSLTSLWFLWTWSNTQPTVTSSFLQCPCRSRSSFWTADWAPMYWIQGRAYTVSCLVWIKVTLQQPLTCDSSFMLPTCFPQSPPRFPTPTNKQKHVAWTEKLVVHPIKMNNVSFSTELFLSWLFRMSSTRFDDVKTPYVNETGSLAS